MKIYEHVLEINACISGSEQVSLCMLYGSHMETDEYKLNSLTSASAPKITLSKQGFRKKAKS